MCFVKENIHTKPLVAHRDIICYKTLAPTKKKKELTSVYQGFTYKIGANYFEQTFQHKAEEAIKNGWCALYWGMHSYTSKVEAMKRFGPLVVKCIIPKGSLYYKNRELKEYISASLTIVEVIHEKPGYPGIRKTK